MENKLTFTFCFAPDLSGLGEAVDFFCDGWSEEGGLSSALLPLDGFSGCAEDEDVRLSEVRLAGAFSKLTEGCTLRGCAVAGGDAVAGGFGRGCRGGAGSSLALSGCDRPAICRHRAAKANTQVYVGNCKH